MIPPTAQHQQVDHEPDETVETGHALILGSAQTTLITRGRNRWSTPPDEVRASSSSDNGLGTALGTPDLRCRAAVLFRATPRRSTNGRATRVESQPETERQADRERRPLSSTDATNPATPQETQSGISARSASGVEPFEFAGLGDLFQFVRGQDASSTERLKAFSTTFVMTLAGPSVMRTIASVEARDACAQ